MVLLWVLYSVVVLENFGTKMSQKQTRKRGANYTQEEKSLLLDLITKFKHIIEDKRTNGLIIQRKKEIWQTITAKYNSNCSTGPRDVEQLKSLYDNFKQKTRKTVGESNKLAYINAEQGRIVTEDDLSQALQTIKEDKIQMNKTGGGFWKPKTTDNESKVLAIIQEQIEPLHNPYDSASVFFKDDVKLTAESYTLMDYDESVDLSCEPKQQTAETVTSQEGSSVLDVITPKRIVTPARSKFVQKKKVSNKRKLIKSSSAEALKRLYFKKKCQNADLERKKLMTEIISIKKEHSLRMQLLKKN